MAIIKINRQNFYHNLNQITLQTGSVEKVAIVLKDNAYGHGLQLMATLAAEYGITQAVVRNRKEAQEIASLFEHVLILGGAAQNDATFSYVLNTLADIEMAQKGAKVELKVDTGMHRNGIAMCELEEALHRIEAKGLVLVGVMTHYRSADVLSSEFFWQQKQFEQVKKTVKAQGFHNVRFHSHNSASILRTKHFSEDLVRVGIGAYGYNELPACFETPSLKPVLSLHAKRIATRALTQGQRVGYGGDFVAPKAMVVSTYDVGYGDGFMRGNYTSSPLLTAKNLPLLGRVSMDFVTLESQEEEVCIFDDAKMFAKQLGTISYEVLTLLQKELPREIC